MKKREEKNKKSRTKNCSNTNTSDTRDCGGSRK